MPKKKLDLRSEESREKIFLDIIGHLLRYNDAEKRYIAEEAGVSWVTLYNWCSGKTFAPQIRTLAPVARAMGYDIVLTRRKAKPPLRRIK